MDNMKNKKIIIIGVSLCVVIAAVAFFVTRKDDNVNTIVEKAPEVEVENNTNNNNEETNIIDVVNETPVVEGNNDVAQEEVKPVVVSNKNVSVKNTKPQETKIDDVVESGDSGHDDYNDHDVDPQPQEDEPDEELPIFLGNDNGLSENNEGVLLNDDNYLERRQAALKIMYEHSNLPKVRISN